MRIWKIFRSIPRLVKYTKAPTAGKKAENKAIGVSKGGRNTKIHTLVDGLGNPLAFLLSPDNDHDSKYAIPLLSQVGIERSNILGDKAYGAKAIREYIDLQKARQKKLCKSRQATVKGTGANRGSACAGHRSS